MSTSVPEEGPLAAGATVGHFRIMRPLGRGAFGNVHLAEDIDIPGRTVAIKTLRAGAARPDAGSLRHEAAALAALQHPHILVVHEVGEFAAGVYLAAEFMPAGSLADRLRRGPLPLPEGLIVARCAADALATAHDHGIVHRDFKPANLLVAADGTVKVGDFGIALRGVVAYGATTNSSDPESGATITVPSGHARGIAGTPQYVPPELFEDGLASPRGDQFSFGAALHEILTGKSAFDPGAGLRATLATPHFSKGIPPDLRTIVARCLERVPARRFHDMHAVVAALDGAISRRSPERRRTRRIAIAFATTVFLLVSGWQGWRWSTSRHARRLNEEGRAALERGDREAARAAFVAAHAADPTHLPACTNLGILAGVESNPAWAVTILRDCAGRFPAAPAVRYNLGAALRSTGNLSAAERELRAALERAGPAGLLAPVANELALVLIDLDRAEEAVGLLEVERMLVVAPMEQAVLTKTTGLALLADGRPGPAVAALRSALAGSLPIALRAEALVALGEALERSGQAPAAVEAFAQAIAEGAGPELTERARNGLRRAKTTLD